MTDFDMAREPESRLLTGINLWEIREAKVERSKNGTGDYMLSLKFKCGDSELKDRAMLQGGGYGIGREKLTALGFPPTWSGSWADLAEAARGFLGRKVWVATVEGKFEGIDKKTGMKKWFSKLEVDIAQLEHAGYQAGDRAPAGAAAGLGPAADDDTPF